MSDVQTFFSRDGFHSFDVSDVFDNWSTFLAADDDDDDDDFVSIGYSRFSRQSFTLASCPGVVFCFLSLRCLSFCSVCLSLLVVCFQSLA